MKNTIIQTAKVIMLGVILSAGIAFAQNWSAPQGTPTTYNAPAPINVSSTHQIKNGAFGTGPLAVFGNSAMYGNVSILGCTSSSCTNPNSNQNNPPSPPSNSQGFLYKLGTTAFADIMPTNPPNPTYETSCFDLVDNDGDTYIDMADPDCTTVTPPTNPSGPSNPSTNITPSPTPSTPTSNLYVSGGVTVGALASSGTSQLCANSAGLIVLCTVSPTTPPTNPPTPSSTPCNTANNCPRVFNTSGSFTVPAGVTNLIVQTWGGGGGGGSSGGTGSIGNPNYSGSGGGGGSGGYATSNTITVTPGQSLLVAVGSAGPGNSSGGSPNGGNGGQGGPGGESNVRRASDNVKLIYALGGQGGFGGQGKDDGSADGIGGAGGNGGTPGGNGSSNGGAGGSAPNGGAGGAGGLSASSNGGQGGAGGSAITPGGGGGGAGTSYRGGGAFSGNSGGNGAPGKVIISW